MSVPPSILQLIEGSGNTFHAAVARWFRARDWHTLVSPYYMDQTQSKARELDLVTERIWPVRDAFNRWEGEVVVRLFVECKYLASESVFWFAPKDVGAASKLVCSLGPFRENNTYTQRHHYLSTSTSVAKVFASNNSRTQENDPFYKALNQALNATVSMRTKSSAHPELQKRAQGQIVLLDYPVIVCNSFSRLYSVDFFAESEPSSISDNFQIEVQYAYQDRSNRELDEYFLVDVVEFEQLEKFVTDLEQGTNAAVYLASSS